MTDKSRALLTQRADAILDARALYPESSLADLYDPRTMPADLRKAHTANDAAVDKLYRPVPFSGDRERVEHLLALYEALSSPLLVGMTETKRKRTKGIG